MFIIAVSDNEIEQLSNDFPFKNQLVVHTSGSVSMRFLNAKTEEVFFIRFKHFQKLQLWILKTFPFVLNQQTKTTEIL